MKYISDNNFMIRKAEINALWLNEMCCLDQPLILSLSFKACVMWVLYLKLALIKLPIYTIKDKYLSWSCSTLILTQRTLGWWQLMMKEHCWHQTPDQAPSLTTWYLKQNNNAINREEWILEISRMAIAFFCCLLAIVKGMILFS